MRREDAARDALRMSGDGERTLSASRRTEHGAEDGGRNRAYPACGHEAREMLEAGQSGAGSVPATLAGLPGNAGPTLTARKNRSLACGSRYKRATLASQLRSMMSPCLAEKDRLLPGGSVTRKWPQKRASHDAGSHKVFCQSLWTLADSASIGDGQLLRCCIGWQDLPHL
jgi:hypothetical protein